MSLYYLCQTSIMGLYCLLLKFVQKMINQKLPASQRSQITDLLDFIILFFCHTNISFFDQLVKLKLPDANDHRTSDCPKFTQVHRVFFLFCFFFFLCCFIVREGLAL